ncbi:MAG: hypothetical protein JST42_06000 [Bacteroidetes bacterium]|nr:hypothetical protein [Bacteroidota bacterium]
MGLTEGELLKATQEATDKYLTLFNNMDQGFCITGLINVVGRRMKDLQPAHEEDWFRIYGEVVRTGKSIHFEKEATHIAG